MFKHEDLIYIIICRILPESDFAILNGSEAAFSAGSTSASIFIKAFEDDIKERIETYFLNIELTPSASSLGVVTVNISATLAIDDNTDGTYIRMLQIINNLSLI